MYYCNNCNSEFEDLELKELIKDLESEEKLIDRLG